MISASVVEMEMDCCRLLLACTTRPPIQWHVPVVLCATCQLRTGGGWTRANKVEVPATTCEQEEQEYTGVSAISTASRELWSVLFS